MNVVGLVWFLLLTITVQYYSVVVFHSCGFPHVRPADVPLLGGDDVRVFPLRVHGTVGLGMLLSRVRLEPSLPPARVVGLGSPCEGCFPNLRFSNRRHLEPSLSRSVGAMGINIGAGWTVEEKSYSTVVTGYCNEFPVALEPVSIPGAI